MQEQGHDTVKRIIEDPTRDLAAHTSTPLILVDDVPLIDPRLPLDLVGVIEPLTWYTWIMHINKQLADAAPISGLIRSAYRPSFLVTLISFIIYAVVCTVFYILFRPKDYPIVVSAISFVVFPTVILTAATVSFSTFSDVIKSRDDDYTRKKLQSRVRNATVDLIREDCSYLSQLAQQQVRDLSDLQQRISSARASCANANTELARRGYNGTIQSAIRRPESIPVSAHDALTQGRTAVAVLAVAEPFTDLIQSRLEMMRNLAGSLQDVPDKISRGIFPTHHTSIRRLCYRTVEVIFACESDSKCFDGDPCQPGLTGPFFDGVLPVVKQLDTIMDQEQLLGTGDLIPKLRKLFFYEPHLSPLDERPPQDLINVDTASWVVHQLESAIWEKAALWDKHSVVWSLCYGFPPESEKSAALWLEVRIVKQAQGPVKARARAAVNKAEQPKVTPAAQSQDHVTQILQQLGAELVTSDSISDSSGSCFVPGDFVLEVNQPSLPFTNEYVSQKEALDLLLDGAYVEPFSALGTHDTTLRIAASPMAWDYATIQGARSRGWIEALRYRSNSLINAYRLIMYRARSGVGNQSVSSDEAPVIPYGDSGYARHGIMGSPRPLLTVLRRCTYITRAAQFVNAITEIDGALTNQIEARRDRHGRRLMSIQLGDAMNDHPYRVPQHLFPMMEEALGQVLQSTLPLRTGIPTAPQSDTGIGLREGVAPSSRVVVNGGAMIDIALATHLPIDITSASLPSAIVHGHHRYNPLSALSATLRQNTHSLRTGAAVFVIAGAIDSQNDLTVPEPMISQDKHSVSDAASILASVGVQKALRSMLDRARSKVAPALSHEIALASVAHAIVQANDIASADSDDAKATGRLVLSMAPYGGLVPREGMHVPQSGKLGPGIPDLIPVSQSDLNDMLAGIALLQARLRSELAIQAGEYTRIAVFGPNSPEFGTARPLKPRPSFGTPEATDQFVAMCEIRAKDLNSRAKLPCEPPQFLLPKLRYDLLTRQAQVQLHQRVEADAKLKSEMQASEDMKRFNAIIGMFQD